MTLSDTATSITRETLAALPLRTYTGFIHLVNSREVLDKALHDLHRERVIGFDIEVRPAFKKGQSYRPSLVQMSTAHAVYLFQLQQRDFSGALGGILGSAKSVKTGVSLRDDIRQLKQLFPFEEKNMVDIGAVAQRHGIKQSGLRNLTGLFLGFRISKGAQTSNWAMPRLTPKQITYAATDAWVCRELYLKFEQAGILDARDDHSNLSSGVSA